MSERLLENRPKERGAGSGRIRRRGAVALTAAGVAIATPLLMGSSGYSEGSGSESGSHISYSVGGVIYGVPSQYVGLILQAGQQCGPVTPNILVGQIQRESSFRADASSGVAYGISQFTPATWQSQDHGHAFPGNYWNPADAISAEATYDCELVSEYGSLDAALQAYNSGSPDGNSAYSSYIEGVANTVVISGSAPPARASSDGGAGSRPHSHSSTGSFGIELSHAGYDMNSSAAWVQGQSASAPFPGHPGCPSVLFTQDGATFSVAFAGFPSSGSQPPNGISATGLERYEHGRLACDR